jgi:hypothetical protein
VAGEQQATPPNDIYEMECLCCPTVLLLSMTVWKTFTMPAAICRTCAANPHIWALLPIFYRLRAQQVGMLNRLREIEQELGIGVPTSH